MMELVLYSDQVSDKNRIVNEKMLELISKEKVKLGYIPSTGDKDRAFFNAQVEFYHKYGIDDFLFFDLDDEYDPLKIEELLSCDVIHLSAGNPIYFLNNIKRRRFELILQKYVQNGGLLIGVSGGAVQIGRSAGLYKVFIDHLDSAISNIKEFDALGLVDFEILPHYNRWDEDYKKDVKEYSKKLRTIIYALHDGDGIIVNGDSIEFIGNVIKIENGIESLPYNESKLKEELLAYITENQEMVDVLRNVRKLNLPDWYVAAGFIRNYIWDIKHGYKGRTSLNDIDVIYYDPSDIKEEIEKEYEKRLREINPLLPWSVKNQARMHTVKNHHPYKSIEEAMIHWPETATAVGVRLNNDDSLSLIAPFGLHDLFNLILRRSPKFADKEYFRKRYQEKNWLQKWPKVRVIDEELL